MVSLIKFVSVLITVCNIMIGKQIGPQDEQSVNQLIGIFDIAQLKNMEPFLSHANQLKDLRYDIDLIKMNFPQKNHYNKNGNGSTNGNSNKSKSVSFKSLSTDSGICIYSNEWKLFQHLLL